MDFPDPLERKIAQEFVEWLAAVQRVGEGIVKIEQKTTVGSLGHPPHEFAVSQLVAARPQIVHPGFDRQACSQRVAQITDRGRDGFDSLDRLTRRQEEARGKFRRLIEAEVIADPWRTESTDGIAEQIELRAIGPHGTSDGRANAVHELSPWQCEEMLDHLLFDRVSRAWSRRSHPRRLRFDLDDVEQFRLAIEQWLDRRRIGDPTPRIGTLVGTRHYASLPNPRTPRFSSTVSRSSSRRNMMSKPEQH